MTKFKTIAALAFLSSVMLASPVLAQEYGVIGPGSRYGLEPEPDQSYQQQGYGGTGFAPLDATAGVVGGAIDAAGAIATAPFRAATGEGSYAMMPAGDGSCAQRYRSYDPQSGTFLGYDRRRHPCE